METIKEFIEKFCQVEAQVMLLKRKEDINPYNDKLKEYFTFYTEKLAGTTGHHPKTKPDSPMKLKMMSAGAGEILPRYLFKISEYSHEEYGKVYVAYLSAQNPSLTLLDLSFAYFIIEDGGEFKIAKIFLYSNDSERADPNTPYAWRPRMGPENLTFESITGPVNIERYLEPEDWQDGLKIYNDNM